MPNFGSNVRCGNEDGASSAGGYFIAGGSKAECNMHAFILNTLLKDACNKDVPQITCNDAGIMLVENNRCSQTAKALNTALAMLKTPGANPNLSAEDMFCTSNGYLFDQTICGDTSASLGDLMEVFASENVACLQPDYNTTSGNSKKVPTTETPGTTAGATTEVPVVVVVFETLDFDMLMPVVLETGIRQAVDSITYVGEVGDVTIVFAPGSVVASISISNPDTRASVIKGRVLVEEEALAYYQQQAGIEDKASVADTSSEDDNVMSTESTVLVAVVAVLVACFLIAIVTYLRRIGKSPRRRTSQVNYSGGGETGKLPHFASGSQVAWSPGTLPMNAPSPLTETPFPLLEPDELMHKPSRRSTARLVDGGLFVDRHSVWSGVDTRRGSTASADMVVNAPNFMMPRARTNSLVGNSFSPDKLFSEKRVSQKFANQATVQNLSAIPDDYDLEQRSSPQKRTARASDGLAGLLQETATDFLTEIGGVGESTTDDILRFNRRSFAREISTDPAGILNQQAELIAAINSFEADADAIYGNNQRRPPSRVVIGNRKSSSSSVVVGQSRRPTQRYSIDLVTTL